MSAWSSAFSTGSFANSTVYPRNICTINFLSSLRASKCLLHFFTLVNVYLIELQCHCWQSGGLYSEIISCPLLTLCVQIYRCHAVWNNSKRAIAIPCFLLVGGSGNLPSDTLFWLIKLIPKPSLWVCLHCCLERGFSLSTATDNFPVHHRRFEFTRHYSHGCVFSSMSSHSGTLPGSWKSF